MPRSPLFQTFAAVFPEPPDTPHSPVYIFDAPLSGTREPAYCCPICGEIVLPRRGAGQPDHFEHQSGTPCARAPEDALRWAAKQLIVVDQAVALSSGERGPLGDCRADVGRAGFVVDIEGAWFGTRRIAIMVTVDEDLHHDRKAAVVVFMGGSRFKTPMPPNVTKGLGYIRHIKSFQERVFSEEQVRGLVSDLESGRMRPSMETHRNPVSNLKKRADPTAGPLCPACGSPMVIRNVRRGARAGQQFWGCSRYPKCRVTQEIG